MANISTQKILTGITKKDLEGTAMSKDKYSYIALFTYEEDGISIKFPDLPGCYPYADKDNTDEALKNAKEALGLHLWGMEQDHEIIPEPSLITDLKFAANQTPVQIDVFMPPVRKRMNGKKRYNTGMGRTPKSVLPIPVLYRFLFYNLQLIS